MFGLTLASPPRRRMALVLAPLMVAAATLAASANSASAANWHNYANNPPCSIGTYHGMKQGDLDDNVWQGVVDGGACGYHKMCRAGSFLYGSGGGDETYGVDATCIGTMIASNEYYGWGADVRRYAEWSRRDRHPLPLRSPAWRLSLGGIGVT